MTTKRTGCLVALIGLFTLIGSLVVFGFTFFDYVKRPGALYNPPKWLMRADEKPIDKESPVKITAQFLANPDDIYHVIISYTARKDTKTNNNREIHFYAFPVTFYVRNRDGTSIDSGTAEMVGNSEQSKAAFGFPLSDAIFKTKTREHKLTSFRSKLDQQVTVEAEVGKDSKYGASGNLSLVIYHQVPGPKVSERGLTIGAVLVLVGPALIVIGVCLFLVGIIRGRSARLPTGD